MVFPVVMYGCESWTIKKAEGRRIDAFEEWCWRRLLRVPWTARSSQSILKEISPECSLEGLMLKLKLQYFGHLMQRTDSVEKTLMLGKIEGRRRRGWQRMRWLVGITDSMDMGLGELRELVMNREAWRTVDHGIAKSQTQLSDWTELRQTYWGLKPGVNPLRCCKVGGPNLQDLMPDDLRWSWYKKIEIKGKINVMHLNHPKTIPPAQSWKNCLPWQQPLVPKRLEIIALSVPSLEVGEEPGYMRFAKDPVVGTSKDYC